jgi:hypothetical protein
MHRDFLTFHSFGGGRWDDERSEAPLAARHHAAVPRRRPSEGRRPGVAAVKTKTTIQFIDWCPTGFKMGINCQRPRLAPARNIVKVHRTSSRGKNAAGTDRPKDCRQHPSRSEAPIPSGTANHPPVRRRDCRAGLATRNRPNRSDVGYKLSAKICSCSKLWPFNFAIRLESGIKSRWHRTDSTSFAPSGRPPTLSKQHHLRCTTDTKRAQLS